LFHWVRSDEFVTSIGKAEDGTMYPAVRDSDVAGGTIPIAPPLEQRRIVAKLDSLTARSSRARRELDRVPLLIERYKQAVLAKAFSGELTADWRKTRGVRRKWNSESLRALATDIRYGTSVKCTYVKTDTAVLRIPNIEKSGISLDDLKYAHFSKSEIAKLALANGDLLFIRSNGSLGLVGRAAIVTPREAGLLYAGYLIRVRVDQEQIVPRFLLHLFSEPQTRSHIETLAKSTSGVNNINSEQLANVSVPLPTPAEQAEIVRRIDDAFSWLDKLAIEHARAEHLLPKLNQAFLAKAFRGELVPQDPNDEPAEHFLSRVKTGTAIKTVRAKNKKWRA
jgi:type I restriction enzyme S subunit